MLEPEAIATLRAGLSGNVLLPGGDGYDEARQVWNAMIDRYPAAIVQCQDESDVVAALQAARTAGLAVSVRGGGHNIGGTAVADDALMIDMSAMRTVEVDATDRIARVGGGATWAQLDAAGLPHDLAASGGVVSTTGVAGLTLGGGFGWLARQHGLAADNLIEARIVLAGGEAVTVSADSNPDIFWAIRGGSGNFGVAVDLTFRLHPVGRTVLHGPTFFSLDDAKAVLTAYAAFARELPRQTCVWANLMTAPPLPLLPEAVHGRPVLNLMQFHDGDHAEGRLLLKALYGGAKPLGSALQERSFIDAQKFLDQVYDFGARNYWRAHNHMHLSEALIDEMVGWAADLPTPESEILICQLGGAIADVDDDASAFPHRQVPFVSTPGVRWRDPSDDTRMIDWLMRLSERLGAHAVPGAYVNFIAETSGRAVDAYGSNLARLAQIKQTYDPDNLFRANQNVPPGD